MSRALAKSVAALLLLGLHPCALLAADAPIAAPPSVSFSVIRMIGGLCLVLSLLFTGVWCFRNWQRLTPGGVRAQKLKIIESRSLGQRHAIFVVAYEQQRLLLATSPTGVSLLTHLPEADGAEPAQELPSFPAALLQAVVSGKK